MTKPGFLLVVSGPSGAGKSTMLRKAMEECRDMRFSVSATTRDPRDDEKEGVDYFFVSRARFDEMQNRGELLESAEFAGHHYGTPTEPVRESLKNGRIAVLDIEARGAMQVRARHPDCVLVYVCPTDISEVERRLRSRRTESEEKIRRRMAGMYEQLRHIPKYDYMVANDHLDEAVRELLCIVDAERCRTSRMKSLPFPNAYDIIY
ncbi:MAG: guanylate kinase [Oscillospiraceae bacterium]|jgi:guanylate kinase|nr:guanylate kinase [Oscillospiraceae bacterium]